MGIGKFMRTHFSERPFLPGNGVTGGSIVGVIIGFLLAACFGIGNCYFHCNRKLWSSYFGLH